MSSFAKFFMDSPQILFIISLSKLKRTQILQCFYRFRPFCFELTNHNDWFKLAVTQGDDSIAASSEDEDSEESEEGEDLRRRRNHSDDDDEDDSYSDDEETESEEEELSEGEMRLLNMIKINKIDVKLNFPKVAFNLSNQSIHHCDC